MLNDEWKCTRFAFIIRHSVHFMHFSSLPVTEKSSYNSPMTFDHVAVPSNDIPASRSSGYRTHFAG